MAVPEQQLSSEKENHQGSTDRHLRGKSTARERPAFDTLPQPSLPAEWVVPVVNSDGGQVTGGWTGSRRWRN